MNMCRYFLCFAVFSFIGWAYESVYYTIQQRKWINSGFLSTCFCPIYGVGAMLDLVFLGWVENTYVLFFAGMIITTSLEYFVSWLMEMLFHRRWWDYTNWPVNINGRVCLFGGMAFGMMTVLLIRFIAPFVFGLISSLGMIQLQLVTIITAFIMAADTVVSVRNIDSSKLWYIEKQSEIFAGFGEARHGDIIRRIKDTLRKQ